MKRFASGRFGPPFHAALDFGLATSIGTLSLIIGGPLLILASAIKAPLRLLGRTLNDSATLQRTARPSSRGSL